MPPDAARLSTTLCLLLVSHSSLTLALLFFYQGQTFLLGVPTASETLLESEMHPDNLSVPSSLLSLSATSELAHGGWRLEHSEGYF